VHLSRQVNLLEERGRAAVETFADRFGGRVAGLVVRPELTGLQPGDPRLPELAADVQAAAGNGGAPASLTLEIHQVEGRRPLADAAGLFRHWRDLTNAERMNHWLAVLGEHAALVTAALDRHNPATR